MLSLLYGTPPLHILLHQATVAHSQLDLNTIPSENLSLKPWLSLAHAPMMQSTETRSPNVAHAGLDLLVLLPQLLEGSDRLMS